MYAFASIRRNAIVLTTIVIVVIIVIATVMSLNPTNHLDYDGELNALIEPLIHEENNEKIFTTTNSEHDVSQQYNVLDVSGGGLRNTTFIAYLLRLNAHYLNENIDMLRLFNVFGGVSAGSIITGAIAYREQVLKNVVKNAKPGFIRCMKLFKYSDAQIAKCIEMIYADSRDLNYGTVVLQWMFHEYLMLKDQLFNVSWFDEIATLNGALRPRLSSDDKRAYLKRYFDFDMGTISPLRIFITCAINIPKNGSNSGTPNKIIVFSNSARALAPTMKPDVTIRNVADIIHISTHTIGFYPVNSQYPFAWDATAYMNNISTLLIPSFLNHSATANLNYFALSNIKNLTYESDEGTLWWANNVVQLVRIQTKYDMQLMKYLQKNKYHNVAFDNINTPFDASAQAMLNDLRIASKKQIMPSVKFIRDEMLGGESFS
jgi:hypothetical protein